MKAKILTMAAMALLLAGMSACSKDDEQTEPTASAFDADGATTALFSVSPTKQVHFSRGNLQFQASTGTWRFAEKQYICCGGDNGNIAEHYDGWSDLFGWGTSGWESGAVEYQPWAISVDYSDYWPGGSPYNSLVDDFAEADWGVHNAISNGGNRAGIWSTLTGDEWVYLLGDSDKRSGKWAVATIDGLHGMVVLPDDWECPNGLSFISGQPSGWETNSYTVDEWERMEQAGAIFLPAAGMRQGTTCGRFAFWPNATGLYWSSTGADESAAFGVNFIGSDYIWPGHGGRSWGCSVRLVKE